MLLHRLRLYSPPIFCCLTGQFARVKKEKKKDKDAPPVPPPVEEVYETSSFKSGAANNFYRMSVRSANVSPQGRGKFTPHHLMKIVKLSSKPEQEALIFEAYYNYLGHFTKIPSLFVDRMVSTALIISKGNTQNVFDLLRNHNYLDYFPHYSITHSIIAVVASRKDKVQREAEIAKLLEIFICSPLIKFDINVVEALLALAMGRKVPIYQSQVEKENEKTMNYMNKQGKTIRYHKLKYHRYLRGRQQYLFLKRKADLMSVTEEEKKFGIIEDEKRINKLSTLSRRKKRLLKLKGEVEKKAEIKKEAEKPTYLSDKKQELISTTRRIISVFSFKKKEEEVKPKENMATTRFTYLQRIYKKKKNFASFQRKAIKKRASKKQIKISEKFQLRIKKNAAKRKEILAKHKKNRVKNLTHFNKILNRKVVVKARRNLPLSYSNISRVVKLLIQRASFGLFDQFMPKAELLKKLANLFNKVLFEPKRFPNPKLLTRNAYVTRFIDDIFIDMSTDKLDNPERLIATDEKLCHLAIFNLAFGNIADSVKLLKIINQDQAVTDYFSFCSRVSNWSKEKLLLNLSNHTWSERTMELILKLQSPSIEETAPKAQVSENEAQV